MSFITKRGLSTLIPPKVTSVSNLGSAPNAKRMTNVVGFYKSLPTGPAPASKVKGPISWYKAKYFDTSSSKPLLHAVLFLFAVGYGSDYYFHLRHHKH